MESTCGCKKGFRYKPCSSQFSTDHVMSVRASCSELTRSELDMVVMGQMMAGMNDDTTTNSESRHRAKVRQRVAITFHHQGKQICERMFRFLHTLGETRYKNLKKSLQSQGLSTRSHGNLKHSPAHALSLSSTEFVLRFLSTMQNRMHFFCQVEYQDTAGRTSSFSLRPCQNVEFGWCTRKPRGVIQCVS